MSRQDVRQEIQRLIEEYQLVGELLTNLQAQHATVSELLEELTTALDGVRLLKGGAGERLVHIGAGLFVKGVFETKEVLTPLGAGYHAFLDLDNAERVLQERIEEYSRLKTSLEENIGKLAERAEQIRQVLERLGIR
ncbi:MULTISPECIES: prefoldin subunit alpha [Pyrobaculum]|uniref:Prefoldin subunit alpha n=2 Tax=Pyrobaculum arsenaticum TaxID=121277 RepID=PFDA_PYRAR|nr:prefoldin subunit alpha [Pyrobaculum arsenaticum]A4WL93.1 RecName: Full=Prefoldin subunit alpha; AltName: Full=GimC subunit alpha [Pyrobaculum arsenaticum DSM 13514]ABP51160.1 transcriptional regulator, Fis family [Pyrobaculum arsenaticum DSM 13514]MCY0891604.1 prefoldin subunit alpha [Pyrobaculum arsenaticum]NYR15116.1 prefoldin subunit alpha [Pyrobaculum arsenaticum]